MISVTRTGSIPARPDVVWDRLADFGAIVAWAPNVDHSCLLTEQTTGAGTARRVQAGRTTLVETVTEWTPPTGDEPGVLTYTLAGLPKVVRSATNSWRLIADGDRTRVELTSTVDAGPRPPQRVIARVVTRVLARASDAMIAGLSAHIQSIAPTREGST
jgi:carbon monoxide dehydrogenase subunit G